MIQKLHIRNYALIRALEIEFSPGMTIITGETGAGKSILLGALGLILGQRADHKTLNSAQEKCVVEGVFGVSKYDITSFFKDHDIDYDPTTIIRREISPSGRTRAFINDTPVNLKVLTALSSLLIDVHHQFEQLDIHQGPFQMRMLDALANNSAHLGEYQDKYKEYKAISTELATSEEKLKSVSQEMDYVQFQCSELDALGLESGELEKLESEQWTLSNTEEIAQFSQHATQMLTEGNKTLIDDLQSLFNQLDTLVSGQDTLKPLSDQMQNAITEIRDISASIADLGESIEYDPDRVEEVNGRLSEIYKLLKKHQVQNIDGLLQLHTSLQAKLKRDNQLPEHIESLKKSLQTIEIDLKKISNKLSKTRAAVIPQFESSVSDLLTELSMPHAQLKIDLSESAEYHGMGKNDVQFLFSTNPGSSFLPIKDIASGGELSRLNLCTKSLVASAIPLPSLVFDEIDTGISGQVALKMGDILHNLSRGHQIIAITHTPQVAAAADMHYHVHKESSAESTETKVVKLELNDRLRTIATMLSTDPPSESAIQTARELLDRRQIQINSETT